MKITKQLIEVSYVNDDYIDVGVWLDFEDDTSWRVLVFKDMETNTLERYFHYAETPTDSYDDTDLPVPQEVLDFIAFNMAEILVKIGRAQAEYELKQNHSSPN